MRAGVSRRKARAGSHIAQENSVIPVVELDVQAVQEYLKRHSNWSYLNPESTVSKALRGRGRPRSYDPLLFKQPEEINEEFDRRIRELEALVPVKQSELACYLGLKTDQRGGLTSKDRKTDYNHYLSAAARPRKNLKKLQHALAIHNQEIANNKLTTDLFSLPQGLPFFGNPAEQDSFPTASSSALAPPLLYQSTLSSGIVDNSFSFPQQGEGDGQASSSTSIAQENPVLPVVDLDLELVQGLFTFSNDSESSSNRENSVSRALRGRARPMKDPSCDESAEQLKANLQKRIDKSERHVAAKQSELACYLELKTDERGLTTRDRKRSQNRFGSALARAKKNLSFLKNELVIQNQEEANEALRAELFSLEQGLPFFANPEQDSFSTALSSALAPPLLDERTPSWGADGRLFSFPPQGEEDGQASSSTSAMGNVQFPVDEEKQLEARLKIVTTEADLRKAEEDLAAQVRENQKSQRDAREKRRGRNLYASRVCRRKKDLAYIEQEEKLLELKREWDDLTEKISLLTPVAPDASFADNSFSLFSVRSSQGLSYQGDPFNFSTEQVTLDQSN